MNNSYNIKNLFKDIDDNNLYVVNSPYKTHSFQQGEKFKKNKSKIFKNQDKKKKVTFKEGYSGLNLQETNINQQALNVLTNTNITPSQQQANNNLVKEYNNALSGYSSSLANITGILEEYFARISPSNPYLGKNIRFSVGAIYYVTRQGIAKVYDTWDIYTSTAGMNGCPSEIMESVIELSIPWSTDYTIPGNIIPTTPNLIVGTPMISGQSCGNEGQNVIVNSVINKPTFTYEGCFNDNVASPVMTFIGGSPPISENQLLNSNFSEPAIASGTFTYIPGEIDVVPWWCSGWLINNYRGFPTPYPSGNQGIVLSAYQALAQPTSCPGYNYTLSFYACGDATINVLFYVSENPVPINSPYTTINLTNSWQQYTYNIYTPEINYIVGICGTNYVSGELGNVSGNFVAIQNFTFSLIDGNSSQPSFTYETCQEQAVLGGYTNFALQNVNTNTNLGYCAVSNNLISATQLGNSSKYTPQSLWSSGTNQPGSMATLNYLGSLLVNSSSGSLLFQTPAASMSNYVGTYNDICISDSFGGRSMPPIDAGAGWDIAWNYDTCFTAAQEQGFPYFGLQYFQPNGLGQCTVTVDIDEARAAGPATNALPVDSQGVINGSVCSNSIYSTSNTNQSSFYWLVLQDDGNLCIYRGSGPGDYQLDAQGENAAWCAMTNGQQLDANPNYQASQGKTGQNWMPSGTTLAPGEFIGSTNGSIYLIMEQNGNLTLYTTTTSPNCSQMSNGYYGGGPSANAIYNTNETGNASLINNVYYVDPNANIVQYSSDNLGSSTNYTIFSNIDTIGNDLGPINNSSLYDCEQICNDTNNCAGFVFDSSNTCFPKNNNMWPYSNNQTPSEGTNTYVKMNQINNGAINGNNQSVNTDSVTAIGYPEENQNALFDLANLIASELGNLNDLENNINNLANQIVSENINLINNESEVFQQAVNDKKAIVNFLEDYKVIEKKINNIDMQQNLLQDTGIKVLQENYNYLLWTILAIGLVIVGIHVIKKK